MKCYKKIHENDKNRDFIIYTINLANRQRYLMMTNESKIAIFKIKFKKKNRKHISLIKLAHLKQMLYLTLRKLKRKKIVLFKINESDFRVFTFAV